MLAYLLFINHTILIFKIFCIIIKLAQILCREIEAKVTLYPLLTKHLLHCEVS